MLRIGGIVQEAFNAEDIAQEKAYIVLVIDDFGNDGVGTQAMMALDIPVTVAVMPFMPYSAHEAQLAHDSGLEVILHVPMEPMHGKKEWLGPKGITTNLADQEIQERVKDALEEIKWAVGINNHMGSKATQDVRVMENILQVAKDKDLFFVDSVTTGKSVTKEVAERLNVEWFKRDIFLDNVKDKKSIEKQLEKLGEVALKQGYAIGIGHVGPEGGMVTVEAIKEVYPRLEKNGVRFVSISELMCILSQEKR